MDTDAMLVCGFNDCTFNHSKFIFMVTEGLEHIRWYAYKISEG